MAFSGESEIPTPVKSPEASEFSDKSTSPAIPAQESAGSVPAFAAATPAALHPAVNALAAPQKSAVSIKLARAESAATAPIIARVIPADIPASTLNPYTPHAAPAPVELPTEAAPQPVLELVDLAEPEPLTPAVAEDTEIAFAPAEPLPNSPEIELAFADFADMMPAPDAEPLVAAPAPAPVAELALVPELKLTPAFAPAAAQRPALAPAPVPELDLTTQPVAELAAAERFPVMGNIAFDLAKAPRALPALAPGSAFADQPRPALSKSAGSKLAARDTGSRPQAANQARQYQQTGHGIEFSIPAVLFGEVVGKVPLRVGGANLISVRLGDLLGLVRGRMDPAAFERLSGSRQAEDYVSFSTLRDAGIDLQYDAAKDRLILGE